MSAPASPPPPLPLSPTSGPTSPISPTSPKSFQPHSHSRSQSLATSYSHSRSQSLATSTNFMAPNYTSASTSTEINSIGVGVSGSESTGVGGGSGSDKNIAAPSMSEEEITSLLTRLSQKDTVTSVIILSRTDGAVIRVAGALANNPLNDDGLGNTTKSTNAQDQLQNQHTLISEYAGIVWRFVRLSEELIVGELGRLGGLSGSGGERVGGVNAADGHTQGENAGDDVKLLRVRTKKGELVVVPEGKFILVVVHDTPGK